MVGGPGVQQELWMEKPDRQAIKGVVERQSFQSKGITIQCIDLEKGVLEQVQKIDAIRLQLKDLRSKGNIADALRPQHRGMGVAQPLHIEPKADGADRRRLDVASFGIVEIGMITAIMKLRFAV